MCFGIWCKQQRLSKQTTGCAGEQGKCTYDDDTSHNHQVPYQIFLPRELGLFELGEVRVDEVCVKENRELGACQHEAGHQAVQARRELEQVGIMHPEGIAREHARVDTDRREEDGGSDGSIEAQLSVACRKGVGSGSGVVLPGNRRRRPVGRQNVGHAGQRMCLGAVRGRLPARRVQRWGDAWEGGQSRSTGAR